MNNNNKVWLEVMNEYKECLWKYINDHKKIASIYKNADTDVLTAITLELQVDLELGIYPYEVDEINSVINNVLIPELMNRKDFNYNEYEDNVYDEVKHIITYNDDYEVDTINNLVS